MPNAPRIVVSNKLVYTERLVADLNFWSEVERYDVYEKCFRYDIFSISILAIDTSNTYFYQCYSKFTEAVGCLRIQKLVYTIKRFRLKLTINWTSNFKTKN